MRYNASNNCRFFADTCRVEVQIYVYSSCNRGSKWLDFDHWRIFLEELSWRKRLNIAYLIDKLEFTGAAKPGGLILSPGAVKHE